MHIKVSKANLTGDSNTCGDARNKLVRQYNFPFEYNSSLDKIIGADHDRMLELQYSEVMTVFKKHTGSGDLNFGHWCKTASPAKIFDLLLDLFNIYTVGGNNTELKKTLWTGFRITCTINRSNGSPVYHLSIFAKSKDSNTMVYTGNDAPNVNVPKGLSKHGLKCWPGNEPEFKRTKTKR